MRVELRQCAMARNVIKSCDGDKPVHAELVVVNWSSRADGRTVFRGCELSASLGGEPWVQLTYCLVFEILRSRPGYLAHVAA